MKTTAENTMTTTIDYILDAQTRLAQCGGKLSWRLMDTKPAQWDRSAAYRPHYRFTITGPGGSYTSDYWASIKDVETGKGITEYDILACLSWFCPETFEDFCAEFGYDADSRKARRTWLAVVRQAKALARIFPSETARELLSTIH